MRHLGADAGPLLLQEYSRHKASKRGREPSEVHRIVVYAAGCLGSAGGNVGRSRNVLLAEQSRPPSPRLTSSLSRRYSVIPLSRITLFQASVDHRKNGQCTAQARVRPCRSASSPRHAAFNLRNDRGKSTSEVNEVNGGDAR